MWGVIPAAGMGSRIQPLAFSKELLPVGCRLDGDLERPRAVSEYLIERMLLAGVDKIAFVISPAKSDIIQYHGGRVGEAELCYVVQPEPAGLCDALFRVARLIPDEEEVVIGLPDTVWFPNDALTALPRGGFSFLCFPVEQPELFDAVVCDENGRVSEIQVKQSHPSSHWVWGAFKLTGGILRELFELWQRRDARDVYVGTLVNAWLHAGGSARAVKAGRTYVDVGTLHGYREALRLLEGRASEPMVSK
ncbi:MAG: sugar phosphate nucleotidyltransferase [Myxococcota bacterium]